MGREMGPWHGDLTVKKRKSEKNFAKLFVAWGNGAWEDGWGRGHGDREGGMGMGKGDGEGENGEGE